MAFYNEMLSGFGDILIAPFKSLDVLWVLVPLFILWIVLEIYFAKYQKEKVGWNTALANGITLGWITLTGMRAVFSSKPEDFWLRFAANIVILVYASILMYGSFTHKISPKWNFVLASPTPVYFLGVFSVMWSYGTLDISRYVLLDLVILFILIVILIHIFRYFSKPAGIEREGEEVPSLEELEEKMPPKLPPE